MLRLEYSHLVRCKRSEHHLEGSPNCPVLTPLFPVDPPESVLAPRNVPLNCRSRLFLASTSSKGIKLSRLHSEKRIDVHRHEPANDAYLLASILLFTPQEASYVDCKPESRSRGEGPVWCATFGWLRGPTFRAKPFGDATLNFICIDQGEKSADSVI